MTTSVDAVVRRCASREMCVAQLMSKLSDTIGLEDWCIAKHHAHELAATLQGLVDDTCWLADNMDTPNASGDSEPKQPREIK